MNRKKTFLVLVLALAAAAAFAMGPRQQVAGDETPRTITFVADNLINEDMGLNAVIEKFYELTGVNLEVIIPPHQQYTEKLQVMAASGDLPLSKSTLSPCSSGIPTAS